MFCRIQNANLKDDQMKIDHQDREITFFIYLVNYFKDSLFT